MRLVIQLWRRQFGAGDSDAYMVIWVESALGRVQQRRGWPPKGREEQWTERFKIAFLILSMLITIAFPLVFVAVTLGYWSVIDVFCVILTVGSAVMILAVNALSRIHRFIKFLRRLKRLGNSTAIKERLRAAYVASTGFEHSGNILDALCTRGIAIGILLLACSLLFGRAENGLFNVWVSICIVILALLKARNRIWRCVGRDAHVDAEKSPSDRSVFSELVTYNGPYNGTSLTPVMVVFALRAVAYGIGLGTLVSLDVLVDAKIDFETFPSAAYILWTVAFYLVTLIKDAAFFAPLPLGIKVSRTAWLLSAQLLQFAIAIVARSLYRGHVFTACLMLSAYGMDYRQGRYFWSLQNSFRANMDMKAKRRALRNTYTILGSVITIVIVAVMLGLFVGSISGNTTAPQVDQIDFTRVQSDTSAAFCRMKWSPSELSVVDFATFSTAAYAQNVSAAINLIRLNSRLSNWTTGWYNFDTADQSLSPSLDIGNIALKSGARFVEFIHGPTNTSVVAVRGTHRLEDVFQDLYLWSSSALLEGSSYFGTLVNLWPADTVAQAVAMINRLAFTRKLVYWEELQSLVRALNEQKPGYAKVVLTGHSLGGGLATIVAAKLDVQAVTFSAPGLGYSAKNEAVDPELVLKNALNIVPFFDPVPKFDKQIGLVQYLPCDAGQPIACHAIRRTLFKLVQLCSEQ